MTVILTSLSIIAFVLAARFLARKLGPVTCSGCGAPFEPGGHCEHDVGLCRGCWSKEP